MKKALSFVFITAIGLSSCTIDISPDEVTLDPPKVSCWNIESNNDNKDKLSILHDKLKSFPYKKEMSGFCRAEGIF